MTSTSGDLLPVRATGSGMPRKARNLALSLVAPFSLFALWWFVTAFGLVPSQILVPPLDLLSTASEMLRDGELGKAVASSVVRVLSGGFAGAAGGIAIGLALGASGWSKRLLSPVFYILAQIPSVAWAPLLLLTLGIGEEFKITIIALAALFPVATSTLEGLRAVPAAYLEVGQVLGLSRWSKIRRIVLPAIGPKIFAGLRIGFAKAWMTLVFAELFSASEGLGHLMDIGRTQFQMDVVLTAVFTTAMLGFASDRILRAAADLLPPTEL